jgi:hypothetical protein
MSFEVLRYEHPRIFVKDAKSGEIHEFAVDDDGTLRSDNRFHLGDARRVAIAYLFNLRRPEANS